MINDYILFIKPYMPYLIFICFIMCPIWDIISVNYIIKRKEKNENKIQEKKRKKNQIK